MITKSTSTRNLLIQLILLIFVSNSLSSQTGNSSDTIHEITIFAIPTLHPLNWESPASLYSSMKDCYIKTIFESDNYLLGHVAVEINSPLLTKPLLIAMRAADAQERIDLVLKQKIGFAIMGATLKGRLETETELIHKFNVYAKRKKMAFITYRINEKAAQRIISFIETYSKKTNNGTAPCDFYGGAFWPRYRNEGAGCSAFGMALLSTANLLNSETEEWRISVKIPMKIIGGEYNQNKKIKYSEINKTKEWYTGEGVENIDYVINRVYEPSVIFDWILKKREQGNSDMKPIEKYGAPGLWIDCRNIHVPENEPIFKERNEPSDLFIKHFQIKTNTAKLNN